MNKIISNPICVFCGKQYPPDSIVYENSKGFCYCSIECILKSKGFKSIKWSNKYKTVNQTICDDCLNLNGKCDIILL